MLGGPCGGLFLGGAADLADHDDPLGLGVLVEHLEDIEVGGAVDRIAADADAAALSVAARGELPDGLVGEGAGAGDDTDGALLVDVARGDADAAAAVGILAGAGGDESGAVRADEAGLGAFHRLLDLHHVDDGDSLGDGDDEIKARGHTLEDRIRRERGRDEDGRDRGAGLADGLIDGIEDRNLILEELASLARGDAGHHLGAVVEAELGVACSETAGDALDEDLGVGSDENRHR